VIDPLNGSPTPTHFAVSCFDRLGAAVENLRIREGTTLQNIGYLDLVTGRGCTRYADLDVVREWAAEHSFNAIVWTDLESNFEAKSREPFSVDAAIAHLAALTAEATEAFKYIRNAPAQVDTPVRRAATAHWPDRGLDGKGNEG
jgi:hypothetical protein